MLSTESLIDKTRLGLKTHHDDKYSNTQRWGWVSSRGGIEQYSNGCYQGLYRRYHEDDPFGYVVFQGDGVVLSLEELSDFDKQNEKVAEYPRAYNQFEGTDRSLKWVEFLLSDKSPWKGMHKHFVITDAAEINQSGWLLQNIKDISPKLLYNFAMAQRMLWENAPVAGTWFHLVDHGVSPEYALFIASNFSLSPGATSIEGPYSVFYPWSFLEGGTLCCARRFITGNPNPKNLGVDRDVTPNVLQLWQCENFTEWRSRTMSLSTREDITLKEILDTVEEAVQTQEV